MFKHHVSNIYFHMNLRFESAMSYHVWRHAEMIFSNTKATAHRPPLRFIGISSQKASNRLGMGR